MFEVINVHFILILRDLDPENPQHEQYVTGLVGSLIQELEAKANTMTTEDLFLTKLKLIEAANMFRVSHRKIIPIIILADCWHFFKLSLTIGLNLMTQPSGQRSADRRLLSKLQYDIGGDTAQIDTTLKLRSASLGKGHLRNVQRYILVVYVSCFPKLNQMMETQQFFNSTLMQLIT